VLLIGGATGPVFRRKKKNKTFRFLQKGQSIEKN